MVTHGFDPQILMQYLHSAAENLEDIHYLPLTEAIIEISKPLSTLGKAMSFAFSDITSKAAIIRHNFSGKELTGIQSMITHELNLGVERVLPNKTPSTTRTTLRILWFFDFLAAFLGRLERYHDWKLSKICRKAYNETLGTRHPWAMRIAAKIGMKTISSKAHYLGVFLPGMAPEAQTRTLKEMVSIISSIKDSLWRFLHSSGISHIP